MRIASVGRALPAHRYTQAEIRARLEHIWSDRPSAASRLGTLHENVRVDHRHLTLPLERYGETMSFGASNDHWIEASQELGERALTAALDAAGLRPADVDALFVVSITGVASPSLDARLMNRMDLRPDLKRIPIFGLGCVAGAAGIARAADYVKAYPDQVAVLLSVELCSLTFQAEDTSVANLISSGLFGDGAAAVVVLGEERAAQLGTPRPRILATRSVFYPDTEDLMGWHITERGFDIVLSPAVPSVARERLGADVDAFLASHGLERGDIASWVCHPGGPKLLAAMAEGLGLTDEQVEIAWKVLAEQGNLSSTSVLMVLEETLARGAPPTESHGPDAHGPGTHGLVLAMGPAFCSELVLFEWA